MATLQQNAEHGISIIKYSIFINYYLYQKLMAIDLIRGGRIPNRGLRQTKSTNAYLKSLIKLYSFLGRRTDSKFNNTIHKRLNQTRLNRYPMSLSRVIRILSKDKLYAVEKDPLKRAAKDIEKNIKQGVQKVEKVAKQVEVQGLLGVFSNLFKKHSNKAKPADHKVTPFNSRIVAVVGTITNDNRILNIPEGLRICALRFTNTARARIVKANGECLTFDQLAQIAPTGKNVLLLRGPRDREAKRFFGLYPGQKGSHTAPRVRTEGRKWERARGRR